MSCLSLQYCIFSVIYEIDIYFLAKFLQILTKSMKEIQEFLGHFSKKICQNSYKSWEIGKAKFGKFNSNTLCYECHCQWFSKSAFKKIFVNVTLDCYYYFISYKNGYTIVQNNFKKLIV